MNCALCNEILDESLGSREHLILNAIGGRRKVRGVLCMRCNNTAGAEWDTDWRSTESTCASLRH